MTLDIAAIKARAEKAARMWTLDSHVASARDIPALLAALEASEAARVKAEQDFDKCREHLAYREVTLEIADDIEALDNARITALEAERDALKEALKPFDDFAQYLESETEGFMDDEAISCEYRGDIATAEFPDLKFGHFRAARRALEGKAND